MKPKKELISEQLERKIKRTSARIKHLGEFVGDKYTVVSVIGCDMCLATDDFKLVIVRVEPT